MKKLLVLACAALLLVGCSKSVGDQLVDLCKTATEKVKAAQTLDDFKAAAEQFQNDFNDFMAKLDPKDVEALEADEAASKAVDDAQAALQKAVEEKAEEFKVDPVTLEPVVEEAADGVLDKAKEVAGDAAKAVKDAAGNAVDAMKDAIGKGADAVKKAVE